MATDPTPAFGLLLRGFRLRAGVTQRTLAERAGLSLRGVSDLERAVRTTPYADTVDRLVNALELGPADRAILEAAARRRSRTEIAARANGNTLASSSRSGSEVAPPAESRLPTPLARFVGRETQIAHLRALVPVTRLLTLTGVGGIGKTRLALEVARDRQASFRNGAYFIDLGPLESPGLIAQAVARVLGVREGANESTEDILVKQLAHSEVLMVLDNCEHLLSACAHFVEHLLLACPEVHVLATSREIMGIVGESVYRVPPLTLPVPSQPDGVDAALESEAVRLFLERAPLATPGFSITDVNVAAVVDICRRLDGIPLALELAAARLRLLSIQELAERLEPRFNLLTSGSSTAAPRQHTLRAVVDWSYELLEEPERILFQRLAVFAGTWSLEAAEAACAGEGLKSEDVLQLLGHLVDKSLVLADTQPDGRRRYRFQDTLHEYAAERLRTGGQSECLRRHHARYFLALAETADQAFSGPRQALWLDRLEHDQANFRAALQWTTNHWQAEETEIALRLIGALARFWEWRGYISEGRKWAETVLARSDSAALPARISALTGAIRLEFHGEPSRLRQLAQQCLELSQADVYARSRILASRYLAYDALGREDDAAALQHALVALEVARALGEQREIGFALRLLGILAHRRGDLLAATRYAESSLAISRELGDPLSIALCLGALGLVAQVRGEYARAETRLMEALGHATGLGYSSAVGGLWLLLSDLDRARGNIEGARSWLLECLQRYRPPEHLGVIVEAVEAWAGIEATAGDARQAVWLFAATHGLRERAGRRLAGRAAEWTVSPDAHRQDLALARAQLPTCIAAEAWDSGVTASVDAVIESVVGGAAQA